MLELRAELMACTDPQERIAIRRELQAGEARYREQVGRSEMQALLPDVWWTIYGDADAGDHGDRLRHDARHLDGARADGPEQPGARSFLTIFSGRREAPGAPLLRPRHAFFIWPDEIAQAIAWIGREGEAEHDVYQGAHLLTRRRRRKADAAPLWSLYIDLDGPMPASPPLTPAVLIESSPGRHQAYFRRTGAVEPSIGESLNRRLARAFGADPSGWDLTQLLRVPGTRNRKYADLPAVRLVSMSDAIYDPADLAHQLPVVHGPLPRPAPRPRRPAGPTPASLPPALLRGAAREIWRGERVKHTPSGAIDRSASLVVIARMLKNGGVDREGIVTALAERDCTLGWRKYADRPDSEVQYHAIVDLLERDKP